MNKQNICNFFLTFIILCTVTTTADADIIRGRVVDSETKEPLPDASVTLTQKYDFASSTSWGKADSLGVFYMYADGKCTIEASMLGYYSKSKTVLVMRFSQDKKSMDLRCLIAEHLLSQARARYTDLHRATPLERYELLLRRCPGIAHHLPLNAIASFLRPFGSKRQSRAPLRHSPTVVTHPQGRPVFGEIIPNIHKTPEHLFRLSPRQTLFRSCRGLFRGTFCRSALPLAIARTLRPKQAK